MAEFGKINLAALPSHRIMEFPVAGSKTEKIECIVIPIKKNHLFRSEKGNVYMDIVMFSQKEPMKDKDGAIIQTHLVKQSLPKEVREAMTKEEQMAQPIIGSLCIIGAGMQQERVAVQDTSIPDTDDDLPF